MRNNGAMFYPRRPRRAEKKPAPMPAALAMLGADFDPPFGSTGEMTMPRREPPRVAREPFHIEPWPEEERLRAMQATAPVEPEPLTAHEAMIAQTREREELEELPPPGPPEVLEPLVRPQSRRLIGAPKRLNA